MSANGTPSPPDVAELVARARAGEILAWHELFQRFCKELTFECVGRIPRDLRSRFDPEDVIQSAFLSAFEHIREFEYRGEGSFRAWLRCILEHALLDAIKHHCRGKRSPSLERATNGDGADSLADRRSDRPDILAVENEDRRRLRLAVLDLPSGLRTLVELRTDHAWTFGEIADHMQCSQTTVRRRARMAIDRIQQQLHPSRSA
jgi:RNA polymerase sigma-70 factor (ECF subfamily)